MNGSASMMSLKPTFKGLPLPYVATASSLVMFLRDFPLPVEGRRGIPYENYSPRQYRHLKAGSAILDAQIDHAVDESILETPCGERFLIRLYCHAGDPAWSIHILERLQDAERF
ncbi:MAG: hypothetical protein WA979_10760 [Pacificimonas sp.]